MSQSRRLSGQLVVAVLAIVGCAFAVGAGSGPAKVGVPVVPPVGLSGTGVAGSPAGSNGPVFEGPVARAHCGSGALPETALQGEVPLADRQSGRSKLGYRCNLELVGRYQGEGASWVNPSYGQCAYMATQFPSQAKSPGVQVIDVSDPRTPRLAGTLTSPAMLGTWESLKVNEQRGLLAGVSSPSPAGNGVGFFAVYDIKTDCRRPRLLASMPVNVLGHEGNWSPDGKTYWATGLPAGSITAIDVSDPTNPRTIFTGSTGILNHGFGISDDGNRLYMAQVVNLAQSSTGQGLGDQNVESNGLKIFDVSDIQARRLLPQIREVGHVYWTDGAGGQHAIPITYAGRPYIVFVDELGHGAARIIDISDETHPMIVSKLKLEIQMPENQNVAAADVQGDGNLFGYEGHYCNVDREHDPTALACGYFQSGVRVFDIRHPSAPREIAYFNPPASVGQNARLQSSNHASSGLGRVDAVTGQVHGPANLTADWCSSPPRFVGDELWVTCQDAGFMALRFTNNAWPILSSPGCPRATGNLSDRALGLVRLGMTRAKARRAYTRSSDRRKRYEDFFCITPIGVRVGYASAKLLSTVPRTEHRRLQGRVVLALTANGFYALRGVRPGATLVTAAKHLKIGAPFHVGLNYWYLAANGSSTAVLKVRHGIVEEVGIADKRLTTSRKAKTRFLKSFS